jgi:hypothetical protein
MLAPGTAGGQCGCCKYQHAGPGIAWTWHCCQQPLSYRLCGAQAYVHGSLQGRASIQQIAASIRQERTCEPRMLMNVKWPQSCHACPEKQCFRPVCIHKGTKHHAALFCQASIQVALCAYVVVSMLYICHQQAGIRPRTCCMCIAVTNTARHRRIFQTCCKQQPCNTHCCNCAYACKT